MLVDKTRFLIGTLNFGFDKFFDLIIIELVEALLCKKITKIEIVLKCFLL